jgi:hypothetical protein
MLGVLSVVNIVNRAWFECYRREPDPATNRSLLRVLDCFGLHTVALPCNLADWGCSSNPLNSTQFGPRIRGSFELG